MNPLMDLLSGLGYVLDTPGAYTRGLLAGRPGDRVGGRELLQDWGLVGEEQGDWDAGDFLGFGAEMLLDPTNLIGAGLVGKTAKAAGAARQSNALSEVMRAAGAMPAEIAGLTKVVDDAGNPLRTYHGTPHVFDQFASDKLNPGSLYGRGVYTTADPSVASTYATKDWGDLVYLDGPESTSALDRLLAETGWSADHIAPDELAFDLYRHGGFDKNTWRPSPQIESADAAIIDRMTPLVNHASPNVRMQYLDVRNPFDIDQSYPIEEINRIMRTEAPRADYSDHAMWGTISGGSGFKSLGEAEDFRRRLALAGYDGLTHTGGAVRGGSPHQVYVAFDPSQIYSPYIAPALQDIPSPNPLLGLLAANNLLARPEF